MKKHPSLGSTAPWSLRSKGSVPPRDGTEVGKRKLKKLLPMRLGESVTYPLEHTGEGGRFNTIIIPPNEVRAQFKRVKPLKELSVKERGWTLDVLNIVRRITEEKRQRTGALQNASRHSSGIGQRASVLDCGGPPPLSPAGEFTNEDVYAHARELEQLHPDNRHIKDKIRQQLQVLRDAKLLIHVGSGLWRLP